VSSYRFDGFRLDVERQLLAAGDREIALSPKIFGLLNCLVRAAGRTVTKDELISEVWQHEDVSDATIVQHVWIVRKLLDEDVKSHKYILTVPRQGYRFVARVFEDAEGFSDTGEPAVWREYFTGCRLADTRDRANLTLALRHYNAALAIDPTFAPAWCGVAGAYSNLAYYAFARWEQVLPTALDAIAKALKYDRSSALTYCLLAQIRLAQWDVDGAERAFEKAGNSLDGGSAAVHQLGAFMATWRGEPDRAIAYAKRAVGAARSDVAAHGTFAGALASLGDYENAIASYSRILEADPACHIARQGRCEAYVAAGRFELALSDLQSLPASPQNFARLACIHAFEGNRFEASRLFVELQKRAAVEYVEPHCFAQVHIALGRYDDAARLTERAIACHDLGFAAMASSPLLHRAARERRARRVLADVQRYLCKPRKKIS
jgi:DNA-binding winged helix-turn-helix (wHTH) protein/thioredoxin-like negative regulator of GroEL